MNKKKLNKYQAETEFITCQHHIERLAAKTRCIKTIYKGLIKEKHLTMSYSAFYFNYKKYNQSLSGLHKQESDTGSCFSTSSKNQVYQPLCSNQERNDNTDSEKDHYATARANNKKLATLIEESQKKEKNLFDEAYQSSDPNYLNDKERVI